MKVFVLKIKDFLLKVLDVLVTAAYPPSSQNADDWWKYVDY